MEEIVAENPSLFETSRMSTKPLLADQERIPTHLEDGLAENHRQPALKYKSGCASTTILEGLFVFLSFLSAVYVGLTGRSTMFESLAYFGIATNLVVYLNKVFHEDNVSIAKSITTWTGTCHLTPLLGAIVADSYWGRYQTILVSGLVYFSGMVIVTLSASLSILKPPSCQYSYCPSAVMAQKLLFFSGLYLVAIGSGGIKSALLPFGADQYEDENTIEREKKASFFNWYYFSINLGALISSTLLVWFEENVDWGLGFGISTIFMALAVGLFLTGRHVYRFQRPCGSPFKRILQVLVAALRNMSLEIPTDTNLLHEIPSQNSSSIECRTTLHNDDFRILYKATVESDSYTKNGVSPIPWTLCTVDQVEEFKILLRLLPIWISGIIYSISYAQMNSTFIEQGSTMDSKIGPFSIPPASMFSIEVLSVLSCIFIYDKLLTDIVRKFIKNWHGLSELQRMGLGRFLMIIAMSTSAMIETMRLKCARNGRVLSLAWQLPQYFVFGMSEIFNNVGQLEFFYGQAPDGMRSICTSFSLLSISLGNYMSSLVITIVTFVTTRGGRVGWIPVNLNEGHLDYFFWVLAGINALNFIGHLVYARRYKLKEANC